MERSEIVKDFFENRVRNKHPHWCTATRCGCMGCVNGSQIFDYKPLWESLYKDEPYLTEADVANCKLENNKSEQGYGFRSYTINSEQV